jgi:hypothetical protein
MRINRYLQEDLLNIPSKQMLTKFGDCGTDTVELHVFGGKTLISSNYQIEYRATDNYDHVKEPHIILDPHNDVRRMGWAGGKFRIQYNFHRDLLGQAGDRQVLFVSEISPSRTEVRCRTISTDDIFLNDLQVFGHQKPVEPECLQDVLLNFGDNKTYTAINWENDTEKGLVLKLSEPLPKDIKLKDKFWICVEMAAPVQYRIQLIGSLASLVGEAIPGPNFELQIKNNVAPTDFESWDTILGSNKSNRQKLMNQFVSGSGTQAYLNIDYRQYRNFVHFSSAKERLENFRFKMKLLEAYSSSLVTLNNISAVSQSTFSNANVLEYERKIEEIKNGFDGYEHYLYYKSSSYVSSSVGAFQPTTWPKTNKAEPYVQATVNSAAATAWFASQSNVALDYDVVVNEHNLERTIPFHIREDNDNSNYLLFTNMVGHHFDQVYNYLSCSMQIHDRDNPLYEGLSKDLVYNVLASFGWESYQGFHFQDLWEYALGTDSAGNYGQASDDNTLYLPPYCTASLAVGTHSVEYQYASLQQKSGSMSREELSRETWKRMLNNLPYLLKTKGSERGIKALITTYGLPPTLLRIYEYGGPKKLRTTDSYLKYDKFGYSLEFDGVDDHLKIPWGALSTEHPNATTVRAPDAIEFRFNTWMNNRAQTLMEINNASMAGQFMTIDMDPHPSASNTTSKYYKAARLVCRYNASPDVAASSSYLPFYDNDWWNVMVCRKTASYGSAQTFGFYVAKSADHSNTRITHTSSTDFTVSTEAGGWNIGVGYITLGSGSHTTVYTGIGTPSENHYSGSMQEFRTWMLPEGDQVALDEWNQLRPFHNHTRDPLQIEGYGATGSYDQLITRYSLGADLNRWSGSWAPTTTLISGSQPSNWRRANPWNSSVLSNTNATASGFSGDLIDDWPTEEERFYTAMPDLIGTRELSDKTRIEDSTLLGNLSADRKVERSTYDKAQLDSNRLGVYFSPTYEIDIDIARELGGASFDNYVGNPLDMRDDEYKRLRILRNHYWYKHQNPYNFFEYLKILRHLDHTLFKQIEMLIPARCNAQVGLLVKPNMLERPKVKAMFANRDYEDISGTIDTSFYHVKGNTTTLGGPAHQWFDPKTNKWTTGSAQAGTNAVQAHTGFQTIKSESVTSVTNKSEGALVAKIDTRTHYGHDLEDDGARYIWRYLHHWQKTGSWYATEDAFFQMEGAAYENAGAFFRNSETNLSDAQIDGYFAFEHLTNIQSSHPIINRNQAIKIGGSLTLAQDMAKNIVPRYNGHKDSAQLGGLSGIIRTRDNFSDFGNFKNYHTARISRKFLKPVYWYFAPKQNLGMSASAGGHPKPTVSMSGWSPDEFEKGFYRSGIRPVSRSYIPADSQDYRPTGINNLYHGGCKLVGSDFNMPVLATVDGGPVVEITDTNPNTLSIRTRTADGGDLAAEGRTMTRAI